MHRKLITFFLLTVTLLIPAVPALAGEPVTCMLDWYPNPDHAPLYAARANGFFAARGLDVDIQVPADPNDPLKLVAAGKVDFAVSYQPSVIIARSEGLPVVSIGALVQHPLSSIVYLKSSGIKTPADLKGRKIGYSVEPLYRVLFEAVAEKAGLKPGDYEAIRVGFNLSPPLLTGQVGAVIGAFRNYEAIQIELEGQPVGIFPLEEHGVPDFYELVIIANPKSVASNPDKARKFMAALTEGLELTLSRPDEVLQGLLKEHPDMQNELNRRAFRETLPFFRGGPRQEPARWQAMADFMLERGLIDKPVAVGDMTWFDRP